MSLNKREHDLWYPFLTERDLEICQLCFRTPRTHPNNELFVWRLVIHEKEYKRPIDPNQLCLLCDSCNQLIHPPKQERFKREMPPELAVNREKEPLAREYMVNRILMDSSCDWPKLLASTAEKIGCSIKACDDYLTKLTSDEGKLIDIQGTVYLRGYEPKLKFDFMAGHWIESESAKLIPVDVAKRIQEELKVR